MLTTILHDLRFGARTLRRNPGFTCVAVLALTLGIGAVSAISSVVNSVLLQPLHFDQPAQLVVVHERNLEQGFPRFPLSPGDYVDFRDHNHSLSGILALNDSSMNLAGIAEPERLPGANVTTNFFQVLGVQPALGRTFTEGEGKPGADNVVVLSHRLWQRRFGGRGDVLGQKVKLNARLYTVVGVMRADFDFPSATEVWAPLTMSPRDWQQRGDHFLLGLGRLKNGVSPDIAHADLNSIAAHAEQMYPDTNAGWDTTLESLSHAVVGDVRRAIVTLAAAVGFVLLIACVNLANLLLSRSAGRRREIGIRSALGATRGRLVRQFLTESLLLAALGAVLGLTLAWAGTRMLVNLDPDVLPRAREITVDGQILAFTAVIAVLTVVLFGIVPAVVMAKIDANSALRSAGRANSIRFRRNRLRGVLIIGEVALSLVLLSNAGLLMRSFYHLRGIHPGFDSRGVVTFSTDLPDAQYKTAEQQAAFYDRALERIRSLPGVSTAGIGQTFPFASTTIILTFVQIGRPPVPAGREPNAASNTVSPEYFVALGIPLKAGRSFTPRDNAAGARVAIISEGMARQYYRNENPLGQRLSIGDLKPAEIVGVVGDVRDRQLEDKGRPVVYQPASQDPSTSMYFAVKTDGDPAAIIPSLRAAIRGLDPELPLNAVGTAAALVDHSLSQRRFTMLLMAIFAGLALALAMAGIYGVMSHSVTQATAEIGVRIALGARPLHVLLMVLNHGGLLLAIGFMIGLPISLEAGRLLATQLFEVPPGDPFTYAAVSVILLVTGLAACVVPACRAMRVDPMIALRNE